MMQRAWSGVRRFLDHDLWMTGPSSYGRLGRTAGGLLRLVVAVVRASQDPLLNLQAMGLVYNTLLSLVPLLAVTFSVLKAFGAHYRIEPMLAHMLEPLGPTAGEITGRVIEFVSNVHVGVLGAVGVAGLFYTVLSLIGRVEDALNRIWHVRRSRSLPRKFSDYLSILLVGPVLVFAAFAVIASAQSHWLVQRVLTVTHLESATVAVARHGLPFLLLAAAFTFLYRFLPYARVTLGAAMVGGVTGAILWHLAGIGFTALVASSTSYAAIYSSFAVLVVSLIWLDVAWLVVLIGGQVAYVYQHPASYFVFCSRQGMALRERIGLTALADLTRRYLAGQPPYRLDELATAVDAPLATLEELVDDFVTRGILARGAEPEGIILARAPEQVSIAELLDAIRDPEACRAPFGEPPRPVEDVLARRDRAVREALAGMTLRSLAKELTPVEGSVADLSQYRRRDERAEPSP